MASALTVGRVARFVRAGCRFVSSRLVSSRLVVAQPKSPLHTAHHCSDPEGAVEPKRKVERNFDALPGRGERDVRCGHKDPATGTTRFCQWQVMD